MVHHFIWPAALLNFASNYNSYAASLVPSLAEPKMGEFGARTTAERVLDRLFGVACLTMLESVIALVVFTVHYSSNPVSYENMLQAVLNLVGIQLSELLFAVNSSGHQGFCLVLPLIVTVAMSVPVIVLNRSSGYWDVELGLGGVQSIVSWPADQGACYVLSSSADTACVSAGYFFDAVRGFTCASREDVTVAGQRHLNATVNFRAECPVNSLFIPCTQSYLDGVLGPGVVNMSTLERAAAASSYTAFLSTTAHAGDVGIIAHSVCRTSSQDSGSTAHFPRWLS